MEKIKPKLGEELEKVLEEGYGIDQNSSSDNLLGRVTRFIYGLMPSQMYNYFVDRNKIKIERARDKLLDKIWEINKEIDDRYEKKLKATALSKNYLETLKFLEKENRRLSKEKRTEENSYNIGRLQKLQKDLLRIKLDTMGVIQKNRIVKEKIMLYDKLLILGKTSLDYKTKLLSKIDNFLLNFSGLEKNCSRKILPIIIRFGKNLDDYLRVYEKSKERSYSRR